MAMGEWSEATDPKTGKTYYYNKITKKTQWTKPVEIDANDLKSSDNDTEDPNEVASNWAEGSDPKSKRVYYYNKITKKTQWSKPDCMGGGGGSGEKDKPAAKKASAAAASTDEEEEPAKPAPKSDEWAEAKDPKSGKSYWYNKKTKETTWKNPNEGASAKPAEKAAPAKKEEPAKKVFQKDSDDDDDDDEPEDDGDDDEKDEESEEEEKPVAKKASVASKPSVAAKASVASKPSVAAAAAKKPAAKSKSSDDDDDDDDDHDDDDGGNESEEEKPVAKKPAATSAKKRFDSDEEEEPVPAKKGGATAKGDVTSIKKTVAQAKADKGEDGEEEEEEEDNETHEFRFAKHRKGWINRTFRIGAIHDDTTLLTYKKSLIKKALLKQNRDLDAEAVQCFKNIMSYMGDRKSSKEPIEHAKKMLRNLMLAPSGLRDEVYMQLCKQTTSNPRVESTIKGWELMSFCLATFPPSKHLKNFLGDFIKKHAEDKSNSRIQDLAQQCQERLPIIVQMGQRKQVPSTLELQCLMDNKPVPIRVNLANGTFKSFTVDPYTLNKDVEEMLQQKYNLTVTSPFALYEAAEANVERILEPKDRILDVAASWENKPLVDEVKLEKTKEKVKSYEKANKNIKEVVRKEIKYNSFLYKAKLVLKTTNQEVMSDPEAINLIYIQATSDVVTQRYPSNEKDITVLAALQLQATFGDYKKDTHVPGWLKPKIDEFMPKNLLQKKGTRSDQSISEWETKILAKYQKVSGFTSLEAKLNYLDYVQEWVFYGATFFLVEQRQFKDYPSPLTLGINCEGVLLMHPEKQTVLENYAYTDIVTWGHSDEKFIVVVGNIVQQRKLIFKTVEGKQMNHLIHDYVKFKVKNKEVVPPSD